LTRLVDDLLDVTRIGRGKVQLRRERVDLVELVQHAADDQRAGFLTDGVVLAVHRPPNPLWVDVDPARIIQAVSNLLGNARKFTPARGRVDVDVERQGIHAELRVRDTGVGISTDLLPHVFEPFTQAPQASDRGRGGLGLGLAMVKGFVELHGGSVAITSAGVDRGTEIVLTLPLADAAVAPTRAAMPRLRSRRVLVIEDQVDTAHVLKTALTMLGLEVQIARNGHDALEVAHAFHPEIALCDIGLPGMDGHEVARSFRRDDELRDIYLVALSGYAQPEDVDRATAAGFSRHVAKPASLDTLARVIAEAP
jgi:two-component system CheB/CheR fusion protein